MLLKEIKRHYPDMSDAEQKVADVILADPTAIVHMSMADLSSASDTSDASVMRMTKRVGLSGFYQLKMNLAIETANMGSTTQAAVEGSSPKDTVDFTEAESAAVQAIGKGVSMTQLDSCVTAIARAKTVYTFGWGNTSTIAQDYAHRLARLGIHTVVSDNVEYSLRGILLGDKDDVLIAISHSGQATFTIECMDMAKEAGMTVVLVTNSPDGEAVKHADVVLCSNAPDDLMGDLGQSSHVAELVIGDMIVFFLQSHVERATLGSRSEAVLGRFKL